MRSKVEHITAELARGLRPNDRAARKSNFLVDAVNFKCKRWGVETYEPITWPFAGSPTISFPFPQLIRLSEVTILAEQTSLALVDETTNPWTTSPISLVDLAGNPATLTGGGQWHAVDFGYFVALFNGVDVVFRSGVERILASAETWFAQSGVTIGTGCDFRGRTFLGGFNSANFWNSTWSTILTTWASGFKEASLQNIPVDDIKGNFVFYSSPGGGDFPMWLFYPTVAYAYDFSPTADRMLDELRVNALGWIPMRWQGNVLRIKALHEHLIVYGENGITALTPHGADISVRDLASFGILTRDSVAGNMDEHVLIANSGEIYALENQYYANSLRLQKLDYSEFTTNYLSAGAVVGSFDSNDKDFYFSNGTDNFILSEGGLTKHEQVITSIEFAQGGPVGVASDVDPATVTLVTSPFEMEVPGIKFISWVTLKVRGGGVVSVAADYNFDGSDVFDRTPFYTLNQLRMGYVGIAGIRFRIVVSATDYSTFDLDSISYEWQLVDKRHQAAEITEVPGLPGDSLG